MPGGPSRSMLPLDGALQVPKRNILFRTVALGSLVLAVGCATGKGWWSSTGGSMYGAGATAAKGAGGQLRSMGSAVGGAMVKAKDAITSPFRPKTDAESPTSLDKIDKEDPISLTNMPTKLTPELWVMQGQIAETQGQHAKAMESYTKALEAEPKNLAALVSTARLYERQGDANKSVQYFQKALTVNPSDASIHNDLGLAYAKAGNAAAAKDSLSRAASLDASNIRYRNNLATVLVENNQADEAVNQLRQVVAPAVAHYNVAYLHFTKQNIPAAQQQLQLALQADPNLQQARDLYNRLGGGQALAQAANTYQSVGNAYRAAQGLTRTVSTGSVGPAGATGAMVPPPSTPTIPNYVQPTAAQQNSPTPTSQTPTWMNVPSLPPKQ